MIELIYNEYERVDFEVSIQHSWKAIARLCAFFYLSRKTKLIFIIRHCLRLLRYSLNIQKTQVFFLPRT